MLDGEKLAEELQPALGTVDDDADTASVSQKNPLYSERGRSPFHRAHRSVVALLGVALAFIGAARVLRLQPAVASIPRMEPEAAIRASKADESLPGDHPRKRKGSFLVLGDWGFDPYFGELKSDGCQTLIAKAMEKKMRELGDVRFVVNVGDSFYPAGVRGKEDPQWDFKWRRVYSEKVRSVPWYSVYGNHDYWSDPCACGEGLDKCALVNSNVSDLRYFYMPSYAWFLKHPDLGLDVIALDLNRYSRAWNKQEDPYPWDCKFTACEDECKKTLDARTDESFRLFKEWKMNSTAPNLIVFSHYPTDYFWAAPDFLAELRDGSKHHIEYFGGHRHNVDQTTTVSIAPNNNWLVGGGGGYGCDGKQQGFLVGEVDADSHITTYPVLVDYSACCKDEPAS
jgi:predicted phosphohydrolase